ncbi:MAG TPA: hypothetical protein VGB87_18430, partial [Vicinamibacteria bacterium]
MRPRTLAVLLLASSACGDSPTAPESQPSRLAVTAVAPSSGSVVVVPAQYPYSAVGGVVLPPQSGVLSVTVSIRSAPEAPWAQLYVYLQSGPDY